MRKGEGKEFPRFLANHEMALAKLPRASRAAEGMYKLEYKS